MYQQPAKICRRYSEGTPTDLRKVTYSLAKNSGTTTEGLRKVANLLCHAPATAEKYYMEAVSVSERAEAVRIIENNIQVKHVNVIQP